MHRKVIGSIFITFLFFINRPILYGQDLDIKQIRKFYKQLKAKERGNTPFIQPSMHLVEKVDSLKQIMLIRHGVPEVSRKGWFNRKEAQQFIKAYDSVGVSPLSYTPVKLQKNELDKIYTSTINRAIHTSQLIFGDTITIEQHAQFVEFQRKIISFLNIKMPLGFWLVNSRLLWVLGLNNKGIEDFKLAKQRAKAGATFLIKQTNQDGKLVLVAHGFLIKYLKKYLKKQGWSMVKDGKQEHLGVSLLIKYN